MRQMIRSHGVWRTLGQEGSTGLVALLVAEAFYKFHSFALECLAFLATWYALSWLVEAVTALIGGRGKEEGDG